MITHYKNLDILKKWAECNGAKTAFIAAPGMGMPPGQPPMDPSMMDPAMMGQPPMDPAMMGQPPMDPGMMAPPPMDPGMQAMADQEGMRSMIREEIQKALGSGDAGPGVAAPSPGRKSDKFENAVAQMKEQSDDLDAVLKCYYQRKAKPKEYLTRKVNAHCKGNQAVRELVAKIKRQFGSLRQWEAEASLLNGAVISVRAVGYEDCYDISVMIDEPDDGRLFTNRNFFICHEGATQHDSKLLLVKNSGLNLNPMSRWAATVGNFWTSDFGRYNGGRNVGQWQNPTFRQHALRTQSIIVPLPAPSLLY